MHGEHSAFTWIGQIPGLEHYPNHVVTSILVAGLVVVLGAVATLKLKAAGESALIPEGKLTFRNFFEILAEKLYGLAENVMGHHEAEQFFPVIATLFIFVFS